MSRDIWRRPWGGASVGQISAHLLVSEVELILCNDDEKMKSDTASPTPHALTPRQQCPRCGGAWQRRLLCVAAATPQGRHDGTQGRRLLRVSLRYPGVGSRFSLKQPPGAPCGGMASAQGFLSRWSWSRQLWLGKDVCRLPPRLAQASLGAAADRRQPPPQGEGGPVPAPRRSRRTTTLLHAPCSSKRAPVHPLRQGARLASDSG